MLMDNAKIYNRLAKSLAQLVLLAKMYNFEHPMVKEKFKNTYKEISDFIENNKRSVVLAKSADMLLINGEKIDSSDKLMTKFIDCFFELQLGSIELEPHIRAEDFDFFIRLLCQKEHIYGADRIKQFLSDKKVSHVVARAATFKLVREDEDIVKKGEFINVEDLSPEILEKFSKDFIGGKVTENLKKADAHYKVAAHNPVFLAGLASDLLKDKSAPQDLEKILWSLADYLIDEIGTAKEEEMNRKVLEDVKKKLLSMWQDKPEKKYAIQHFEKTYAVISSALQLKELVSVYKRHKKEVESTVSKIKKIMEGLPVDSQLYQKTKEGLVQIGGLSVDESIFK